LVCADADAQRLAERLAFSDARCDERGPRGRGRARQKPHFCRAAPIFTKDLGETR